MVRRKQSPQTGGEAPLPDPEKRTKLKAKALAALVADCGGTYSPEQLQKLKPELEAQLKLEPDLETDPKADPESQTEPISLPPAEVLPGITLNEQQRTALATMEAFVQGREKLFLLTGYAGTGKTTLLQALLTRMIAAGDRRRVTLTALSNKATKVLGEMAARWAIAVDCMTCCRLLGLKPTIDKETGAQKFVVDRKRKALIHYYDLVIVDECSMINQEMWILLVEAIARLDRKTQLLFVGDPAQLPPINEERSLCFDQIYQRFDLTEVMRYGGAIGVLAENIRQNLARPSLPILVNDTNETQTEGIIVVSSPIWENLLEKAFKSDRYAENPDQVRVLAYTNRRVQTLNSQIRATLYGKQLSRFMVGERLIANAPCLDGDSVLLQTSQECEVLAIAEGTADQWRVWVLTVQTEDGDIHRLRVLHEAEEHRFATQLEHYAAERQWRVFWDLKEFFHEVTYAYCLTVHKSQGSTFQDVFVDLPNLMGNRKVKERNQLCYVAVTRAAKRIFLCQG